MHTRGGESHSVTVDWMQGSGRRGREGLESTDWGAGGRGDWGTSMDSRGLDCSARGRRLGWRTGNKGTDQGSTTIGVEGMTRWRQVVGELEKGKSY